MFIKHLSQKKGKFGIFWNSSNTGVTKLPQTVFCIQGSQAGSEAEGKKNWKRYVTLEIQMI